MNTFMAVASLLLGAISCAPPIESDRNPTEAPALVDITTILPAGTVITIDKTDAKKQEETDIKNLNSEVTEAATEKAITIGFTTAPPPQQTTPWLSGKERKALISHLSDYDLSTVDPLVLTPRQQLAILQELEHQKLGLSPFADPTPWQRLTREQQLEFNKKYLALSADLQEYSRNQFLSLPEDRQAHAYNAFLSVDIQTLSDAIEREFVREREVLKQQRLSEQQSQTDQQRLPEQHRLAEQQSLTQQQRLAEQQRLSEQQRVTEQNKHNEGQRLVEKQILAEQLRLYEQQKLTVEKNLIEQQRIAEQQRISEQLRIAEQQRLAEQQSLKEQHKLAEQKKLTEQPKDAELEQQRQQGIKKLFEVALSQQEESVVVLEQPRIQNGKTFNSFQELNEITDVQFQPSKSVQQIIQPIQTEQLPPLPSTEQQKSFQPQTKSRQCAKLSLLKTRQFFRQRIPPSLRKLQRNQKRLNIRRLNFDPRRRN